MEENKETEVSKKVHESLKGLTDETSADIIFHQRERILRDELEREYKAYVYSAKKLGEEVARKKEGITFEELNKSESDGNDGCDGNVECDEDDTYRGQTFQSIRDELARECELYSRDCFNLRNQMQLMKEENGTLKQENSILKQKNAILTQKVQALEADSEKLNITIENKDEKCDQLKRSVENIDMKL